MLARLSPEVDIGFRVFNPIRTKLNGTNEYMASLVSLGLCYRAGRQAMLYLQSESNLLQPPGLRFGLSYQPVEILHFRIGYCTQPAQFNFGIGLALKKFKIDSGTAFHPLLGPSPHLTLAFP